jgi:hypothetical protein
MSVLRVTKKCPDCGLKIAHDDFEWHIKNGHNEYFVGEDEEDCYEDIDNALNADFLQKNIDATKDYGYPCREAGKYGSLSGYDGFDDESEA